jgi:hypothetical protein
MKWVLKNNEVGLKNRVCVVFGDRVSVKTGIYLQIPNKHFWPDKELQHFFEKTLKYRVSWFELYRDCGGVLVGATNDICAWDSL